MVSFWGFAGDISEYVWRADSVLIDDHKSQYWVPYMWTPPPQIRYVICILPAPYNDNGCIRYSLRGATFTTL